MKATGQTLVVIGGGAAGFFCAVNAARLNSNLKVIIVEKTNKLLSKVKVSGGGRCNLTNACFDITEMAANYPRGRNFVKKTFYQFFTRDTIKWFEERGVPAKVEPDGRVFPISDSSQTVIDCLLREAGKYQVEILMNREVKKVEIIGNEFEEKTGEHVFRIYFQEAGWMEADFLCAACGGYNKLAQYEWLKQLGHPVEEPLPSLFTFNLPGDPITQLMGVSMSRVRIKIMGQALEETGPILITHWGLSGPVILRLSAWGAALLRRLNYEFKILANWVFPNEEQGLRKAFQNLRIQLPAGKIIGKNPFHLPQRFWEFLLHQSGVGKNTTWSDLRTKEQNQLIRNLCAQEFQVRGKTTFKEEFVTAGGISLSKVDAHTMQSKIISQLFFAGEVLDVDGITGGFNFQHAWTSGWIAAKNIAALSA